MCVRLGLGPAEGSVGTMELEALRRTASFARRSPGNFRVLTPIAHRFQYYACTSKLMQLGCLAAKASTIS